MGRSGHRLAATSDVIFLASAWEAWTRLNTANVQVSTSMINDPASPDSIMTDFGYRQWVRSDGTDPFWYLNGTGDPVTEMARFNDRLLMLQKAGLVYFPIWYPLNSQLTSGGPNNIDKIQQLNRKWFSSNKSAKLAWMLTDYWAAYDVNAPNQTWLNWPQFITDLVTDFQDPQYLKITRGGVANRPVVGLFKTLVGTVTFGGNLAKLAMLTTACTNAGLGAPVYIQMNGDVTESNTIGCDYCTTYGPSGTIPAGSGRVAYAASKTKQLSIDTLGGLNAGRAFTMVHSQDTRPRPSEANPFVDTPTYSEWEAWVRQRYAMARSDFNLDPDHFIHMYSISELDEGGPFFPTAQTIIRGAPFGSNPSYGPFLDALINVRNGTFPSTYTDCYHAASVHANLSALPAGWAEVASLTGPSGGTTGAYQYHALQNSTTTNARTMTVTGVRIRVYGGARVGLGTIRFVLDGGANNDVNQATPVGSGYNQLLFDSGTISNTSHTLSVARVSGLCEYDEWKVDISR